MPVAPRIQSLSKLWQRPSTRPCGASWPEKKRQEPHGAKKSAPHHFKSYSLPPEHIRLGEVLRQTEPKTPILDCFTQECALRFDCSLRRRWTGPMVRSLPRWIATR